MFVSVIFLILTATFAANGDHVISLKGYDDLVKLEGDLAVKMQAYIRYKRTVGEDIPDNLVELSREMEQQSRRMHSDPEYFLGNPIYMLHFVHTLATGAKVIKDAPIGIGSRMKWQMKSLLDGALLHQLAEVLIHQQDVYNMSVPAIVRGSYPGLAAAPKLKPGQLFAVAKQAYTARDYYHAIPWLKETVKGMPLEAIMGGNPMMKHTGGLKGLPTANRDRNKVEEMLAEAFYRQGNIGAAYSTLQGLVALGVSSSKTQQKLNRYKEKLFERAAANINYEYDKWKNTPNFKEGDRRLTKEFHTYSQLCQGNDVISTTQKDQLTCHLEHSWDMFSLAPLRAEVISHQPRLVKYYNVLSEKEITRILSQVRPSVIDAAPMSANDTTHGEGVHVKNAFRVPITGQNKLIHRLLRKAREISGVHETVYDHLDVTYYAIGGYFEPHTEMPYGNRLASVSCFLSEAPAGGYSVFPGAGAASKPEKGACLMWLNLDTDSKMDQTMTHAQCPVKAGSSWILNMHLTQN